MAEIERTILSYLAEKPGGATLREIEEWLGRQGMDTGQGITEAVMLLSDRIYEHNGNWRKHVSGKAEAVLEALATYSTKGGRTVFRLDNALSELPVELRPTVDEVPYIIGQSRNFELLKNSMVRRKG